MTTQSIDAFWEQATAFVNSSRYDLRQTQIVANSDEAKGYSADRFKDCFYESDKSLYVQLIDTYESQIDDEKRVEQVEMAKTYLLNHWE